MRLKFRRVNKKRVWQVYDYANKVIESCKTYQQLLVVEGWLYNIPDFDDMELHRKLIDHIHHKEDELLDQKINREVQ